MTEEPWYDEHALPHTSRRRELADRVGYWWTEWGSDILWTLIALAAIAALFGVFGGGRIYGNDSDIATATAPAERVTPDHPGPPWAALERCDLAEWHAEAAGLPVPLFRHIAEAESGCRNDITNQWGRACCHGGWQIHQLWLNDPVVQACGATDIGSLRADTAVSWAVNACAARRILDVQGVRAWQVCTKRIVNCS